MTQPITLGFLTPYSSIYPNFFPHLAQGFFLGLGEAPGKTVQLLPEFAGAGGQTPFVEAAKKLLQFSNVDILSGMISYRMLPQLHSLSERHQKLSLFFDMGELLPLYGNSNSNLFFNSHQLYQSEYALGYWAQKEFGETGIVVTPLYNAGYHLHRAFEFGVGDAGGQKLMLNTIPNQPSAQHALDTKMIFDEIGAHRPSYVHAILVGPQGNEFLIEWQKQRFAKDIPLLVSENMLYEDMLSDVWNLDLKLYGAMLWNKSGESRANKQFVNLFKASSGISPNIYALMGYEVGLLFKELGTVLKKRDWQLVAQKIANSVIETPRGLRGFANGENLGSPTIDIVKVQTNSKSQYNLILEKGKTINASNPRIKNIQESVDTGWINPYLCI